MHKGLVALAVAVALTGTGGVAATAAWASDNASRDMHDRMLRSPEMDAMHTEMLGTMPEEARAACDQMHQQMGAQDGSGVPDHAAHHSQ